MSPYDLIHLVSEPKTLLIGSLMYFATKGFCALLVYRKNTQIIQLYHVERMAALKKGVEIPPLPREFFQDVCPACARRRYPMADSGCGIFRPPKYSQSHDGRIGFRQQLHSPDTIERRSRKTVGQ
jgi:hypothetical protein